MVNNDVQLKEDEPTNESYWGKFLRFITKKIGKDDVAFYLLCISVIVAVCDWYADEFQGQRELAIINTLFYYMANHQEIDSVEFWKTLQCSNWYLNAKAKEELFKIIKLIYQFIIPVLLLIELLSKEGYKYPRLSKGLLALCRLAFMVTPLGAICIFLSK